MPQCFKCSTQVDNYEQLFLHFKIYHSFNITHYDRNENNCFRSFETLNSFKKHVNKVHQPGIPPHSINSHIHNIPLFKSIVQPLNSAVFESNNLGSLHESSTTDTDAENIDFESLVYKNAINLLSKWYNQSGVPRNKIQLIIDDFTSFLSDCLPYLKNEVDILTRSRPSTTNSSFKLNTMFNILSNPYKTLNTEYLRFKAFNELGILIKPRAII